MHHNLICVEIHRASLMAWARYTTFIAVWSLSYSQGFHNTWLISNKGVTHTTRSHTRDYMGITIQTIQVVCVLICSKEKASNMDERMDYDAWNVWLPARVVVQQRFLVIHMERLVCMYSDRNYWLLLRPLHIQRCQMRHSSECCCGWQ